MIFLSKCFLKKRTTYPSPSYIIGVGPATWWLEDNFRVKSAIPRSLLAERLVQFLRSIQGTLKVPTSMANLANPAVFCWLAYSYFSMNISALYYIYVYIYMRVCVALLYLSLSLSLFTANAWEVGTILHPVGCSSYSSYIPPDSSGSPGLHHIWKKLQGLTPLSL